MTASRYPEVYANWRKDPQAFWAEAARDITWFKAWDKVFDPYAGQYGRWFAGAECNTAYNCLDRHVERGRGAQKALIYDSPVTKTTRAYTYADLTHEVATLAGVLLDHGVKKGDRVIIYMPMVPEAVMAMLACARIGAVHSVVFGGFAAAELATRITDSRPVAILAASCGIEGTRIVEYKPLLDKAIELSEHKPANVLMLQRPMCTASMVAGRDVDWAAAIADAKSRGRKAGCTAVAATDPLYILYTSGTTGQPKGVVRDNGGHMVALKWTMKNHYGIEPGEVFWAASDVGWVVGHSYICYAPLLHGATTVVFEGKPVGTPDAGTFWRVIAEHRISALFTAPTAFRAIKKEDPQGALIKAYDLRCLRTLFLAGERADPETIKWAEQKLEVPVVDHWWQTETGWTIAGNPVGLGPLPVKHGSPTVPMPGYDLQVLDEKAHPVAPGQTGTLAIKLPLPPGALPTLWGNDERFRKSYLADFPGYYTTSDAGYRDAEGYVFVMARTDDVINVAGHRLSTGQMEEVVARHKDVAECAVIGVADAMKGQMPAAFVVLNSGVNRPTGEIETEVVKLVRDEIGPVAALKTVMVVKRLPKTRSGKVLRATMRQIADGEAFKVPATIDDPGIIDEITDILKGRGMAASASAPKAAAPSPSSAPTPLNAALAAAAAAAAASTSAAASAESAADLDFDDLRGTMPEDHEAEAAVALESAGAEEPWTPPAAPIEFKIEMSGEAQASKTVYTAVEQATGRRFRIGTVTGFTNKYGTFRGLALYDGPVFNREEVEARHGLWAHFVWPTVMAESNGRHITLNTFDSAHFTWGFYQLAAHTADNNFVLLMRELLKLPLAERYFPELALVDGKVSRKTRNGVVSLEARRDGWKIPDFMAYMNPSPATVDPEEAVNIARLVHWAHADPKVIETTLDVSFAIMRSRLKGYARHFPILGREPELAIWVSDIKHHGRAAIDGNDIKSALAKRALEECLAALFVIDTKKSQGRRETVRRHIQKLRDEKRFAGLKMGEGPLSLDQGGPLVA